MMAVFMPKTLCTPPILHDEIPYHLSMFTHRETHDEIHSEHAQFSHETIPKLLFANKAYVASPNSRAKGINVT